jgi:hypothetical protein
VKTLTSTAFKTPGVSTVQRDGWKSVYVPAYEDITPQMTRINADVRRGCDLLRNDGLVCQEPAEVDAMVSADDVRSLQIRFELDKVDDEFLDGDGLFVAEADDLCGDVA